MRMQCCLGHYVSQSGIASSEIGEKRVPARRQLGQALFCFTRVSRNDDRLASNVKIRSYSGSPIPSTILRASLAIKAPSTPATAPSTPASAQFGTESGGGDD